MFKPIRLYVRWTIRISRIRFMYTNKDEIEVVRSSQIFTMIFYSTISCQVSWNDAIFIWNNIIEKMFWCSVSLYSQLQFCSFLLLFELVSARFKCSIYNILYTCITEETL
jgi:hypothetical protein